MDMRDGWIKAAAASPKIRVADCRYNAGQIQKAMQQAEEQGAQLLVLPELCLTGYTCQDLFLQQSLMAVSYTHLFRRGRGIDGKQYPGFPQPGRIVSSILPIPA